MLPRALVIKNNCFMRVFVICIFIFSLMVGCATLPQSLTPEAKSKIKKIAMSTVLRNKELMVFDHTNIRRVTYGGFLFGAIGGLTDAMIMEIEKKIRTQISLGGDPDLLREQLKEYSIKQILEEKITCKLSEKFKTVNANNLFDELGKTKKDRKLVIADYLDACKKLGADTLLEVDFYYGLAGYAVEKSSAVIIANISVYDVYQNNLLMKEEFISDEYFKRSRIVPDFAANSAELYKKDILEIVDGLSQIVAQDFGLEVDEASQFKRNFDEQESALSLSCKKPYTLEQDCSNLWGAKRTIKINEKEIKVAGSADGKIILVMDNKLDTVNAKLSLCCRLVKEKLLSNGIVIIKVTKFTRGKKDYAYIFDLDNDGYSILKNYTVEKREELDQTSIY